MALIKTSEFYSTSQIYVFCISSYFTWGCSWCLAKSCFPKTHCICYWVISYTLAQSTSFLQNASLQMFRQIPLGERQIPQVLCVCKDNGSKFNTHSLNWNRETITSFRRSQREKTAILYFIYKTFPSSVRTQTHTHKNKKKKRRKNEKKGKKVN